MRRLLSVPLAAALLMVASIGPSPASSTEPTEPPVVVYLTWDGVQGLLVDRLLAEDALPNLQRLVDAGTYIPRTVGNWPSITPAGHAALWTGAYASVNGISTMAPDVLTEEERATADEPTVYGPVDENGPVDFSAENLLVEPLWVTAARAGLSTTAISVTHAAPFEMYTTEDYVSSQGAQAFGDFSDQLLLSDPYGMDGLPPASVTATSDGSGDLILEPTDAAAWSNLPPSAGVEYRSFTYGRVPPETGEGEAEPILLHGLVIAPDGETFTQVVLSPDRDYETGAVLEATPFADDASQLSGPIEFTDCDEEADDDCVTGLAHLRLAELAADGSRFTLWRSYLREHADFTMDPTRIEDWIAAGGAFTGNGPQLPPIDELPPLPSVHAELAYQVNEYFFDNLVYEIERGEADGYVSYSPYPDEWLHQLYAFTIADSPVHTPEREARATSYVEAMMINLDGHLGEVIDALERGDRDWNILLSTDHGFEPTVYTFYPGRALREAGLIVTDEDDELDASRSKVAYVGNGVIRVNREGVYAGGIVPDGEYEQVVEEVRDTLLAVRGVDGEPIVEAVVESADFEHEGLGGPHGGELHLEMHTGLGYYWPAELGPEGSPVVEANPADGPYTDERHVGGGWHGNRVVGNETEQGFAVLAGDGFVDGHVIPQARSTDLVPTIAATLGIEPAEHWMGEVLTDALAP